MDQTNQKKINYSTFYKILLFVILVIIIIIIYYSYATYNYSDTLTNYYLTILGRVPSNNIDEWSKKESFEFLLKKNSFTDKLSSIINIKESEEYKYWMSKINDGSMTYDDIKQILLNSKERKDKLAGLINNIFNKKLKTSYNSSEMNNYLSDLGDVDFRSSESDIYNKIALILEAKSAKYAFDTKIFNKFLEITGKNPSIDDMTEIYLDPDLENDTINSVIIKLPSVLNPKIVALYKKYSFNEKEPSTENIIKIMNEISKSKILSDNIIENTILSDPTLRKNLVLGSINLIGFRPSDSEYNYIMALDNQDFINNLNLLVTKYKNISNLIKESEKKIKDILDSENIPFSSDDLFQLTRNIIENKIMVSDLLPYIKTTDFYKKTVARQIKYTNDLILKYKNILPSQDVKNVVESIRRNKLSGGEIDSVIDKYYTIKAIAPTLKDGNIIMFSAGKIFKYSMGINKEPEVINFSDISYQNDFIPDNISFAVEKPESNEIILFTKSPFAFNLDLTKKLIENIGEIRKLPYYYFKSVSSSSLPSIAGFFDGKKITKFWNVTDENGTISSINVKASFPFIGIRDIVGELGSVAKYSSNVMILITKNTNKITLWDLNEGKQIII